MTKKTTGHGLTEEDYCAQYGDLLGRPVFAVDLDTDARIHGGNGDQGESMRGLTVAIRHAVFGPDASDADAEKTGLASLLAECVRQSQRAIPQRE
jgi:hypothetical protein